MIRHASLKEKESTKQLALQGISGQCFDSLSPALPYPTLYESPRNKIFLPEAVTAGATGCRKLQETSSLGDSQGA